MRLPRFTTLQLLLAATLVSLLVGLFTAAWRVGKVQTVQSICFSPNGRSFAAGYSSGLVRVWRMDGGRPRLAAQAFGDEQDVQEWFQSLHFVDDQRLTKLETVGRRSLVIREFDLTKGKASNRMPISTSYLPQRYMQQSGVAACRNRIFIPDRTGGTAVLGFNLDTRKVERSFSVGGNNVSLLGTSADGARLAVRDYDGTLHVLDTASGQSLLEFVGESKEVFGLNYDGSRIATIGLGSAQAPSIVVLDVNDGGTSEDVPFSDAGSASWIEFSQDGSLLAIACQRGVECYDTKLQVVTQKFPAAKLLARSSAWLFPADWPGHVALAPDGKQLVSHNGSAILFWDVESGKLAQRIGGDSRAVPATIFILGFAAWAAAWGISGKRSRLRDASAAGSPTEIGGANATPLSAPFGLQLCWGLMIAGGLVAIASPIVLMFTAGPSLFPTVYFSLFVGLAATVRGAARDSIKLKRTTALQLANMIAFDPANVVLAAMEYALLRSPRVAEYLRAANA